MFNNIIRIIGISSCILLAIFAFAGCQNTPTSEQPKNENIFVSDELLRIKEEIDNFIPVKKHDVFAIESIKEAIKAAENGNFGVGSILVDKQTGEIVYRGQNKVFSEHRSDLHAEMDLFNIFETENKERSRDLINNYTLYTSLESCPMCLCRIITSGLTEVYQIANDSGGGMVHLRDQLPIIWQEISEGRIFEKADCSEELQEIAEQVFLLTIELNDKL